MNSEKVKNRMQHLQSLHPMQFMDDDVVRDSFVKNYVETHPGVTIDKAHTFHAREAMYFKRVLMASTALQQCTLFSLYACLMDVATNGLSYDPAKKLMYLETKNFNTAPKGQPAAWEARAISKATPYGELAVRIACGQIKYADNVIIVKEGDMFRIGMRENGSKYVVWEGLTDPGRKTIASFVKLTRSDGSFDIAYLTQDDIERMRRASERQNSRGNNNGSANSLYTSENGGIDSGFLRAKTLRHAFGSFPPVDILSATEEDEINNDATMVVDGGYQDDSNVPGQPAAAPPSDPFANTAPMPSMANTAQDKAFETSPHFVNPNIGADYGSSGGGITHSDLNF